MTGHLQARLRGTYQLTQLLQQQLQQSRQQHATASPNNPLHVIEYVVALLSNTLPYNPNRWKNLETREAKACILNQLLLAPTILLSIKFCCDKIQLLKQKKIQDRDIVDIALSVFITSLACAIITFMSYLDRQSSIHWKAFKLPYGLGRQKLGLIVSVFCLTITCGLIFFNLQLTVGPGYCISAFVLLVFNTLYLPTVFSSLALPKIIVNSSDARLSHDAFIQVVFPSRFAKTLMFGLVGGFVWGGIDTPEPDIQLVVVTLLPLLAFLSIPRRFAWAIGCATFAAMAALSLESLLYSLLSGAFALACQAIGAILVVLLMRFTLRPRTELLLFFGIFCLALLCAVI